MKHLWVGLVALAVGIAAYVNLYLGRSQTTTVYWYNLTVGDQSAPHCPETPPMSIDGPRFVLASVVLGTPGASITRDMQDHLRSRGASGVEGKRMTAIDCLYRFKDYWIAFKGLTAGRCRFSQSAELDGRNHTGEFCALGWWSECSISCIPAP